jgi:ketosteroid isomerase-like protein
MSTPGHTDDAFFAALLAADTDALDELLAQDFVIVDVVRGGITSRETFIAAIREALAEFSEIDVAERSIRSYGDAAVIIGRTRMRGKIADESFVVQSRYTHVVVSDGESWRLVSAQGTRIPEPA